MKIGFRLALAILFTGVLLVATVGTALGAVCINTSKPDGAGNFGDVVINTTTGEVTLPTNPGGQSAGGFVDVWLDLDGDGTADVKIIDDTFFLNNGQPSVGNPALGVPAELPEGAHNSGPGDSFCDGVGLDDVEACPAP